ncbi:uncharacterized protein A4U43_C05F17800 [Asparagus officinalis]|uniref:Carboxypeptidase n=1 Tax=Asparagus officinalis TaxID=4686 RepID=A0A5P1EUX3_ASPOF|nr:serine carboxypeptidase II-2-like [Asparagus officinalis]ONK68957.1 uncharacterized protein A4U43_C05F17800 [Asparagus officinalis]
MEKMRKSGSVLLLAFALVLASLASASSSSCSEDSALEKDRVQTNLLGQDFNVEFAHYSGYVTIDEEAGRALFYWFFEAAEDPASKPLALWLTGGPGCSAIAYGMAEEVGPFHVKPDGKSLYLNPYSWNQVANMLFLEAPAGTGFSYSNNTNDVLSNGDERTAKDSLKFLQNWFKRFPQYKGRDFYITGESYGGHFIPQLAQVIVRSQKVTGDKSINLKGYLVGNPATDDFLDNVGSFQYMWTAGLISDETYNLLNVFCDFESFLRPSEQCNEILEVASSELGNIDSYSIFTPTCPGSTNFPRNKLLKRLHSVAKMGEKFDPCTDRYAAVYFNLPEVQNALHVNPVVAPSKWETCSDAVKDNWRDSSRSILPIYRELIEHGLRIWVFSGDADSVIPVPSTRYVIDALKLPTVTPWHPWYDDGQVGGRTQVYEGLTYVTVRGAGHEVPLLRPKQALILFRSYLAASPMPTLSEVEDS